MVYNRPNFMSRRFFRPAVVLVVLALLVGFGTAGSAVRGLQAPQPTEKSAAIAAIAHGKRDAAEKYAKAKGPSDPDAGVILAQLAIARGQYRDAQSILEPLVVKDPAGDAALELALLYRTIGRAGDAQPILNAVLRT